MNTELLNIRNLTFRYRQQPVLDDLSLTVKSGELLVLMGPNGAGKSTILKLVAGLLAPEHGTFLWNGAAFVPRPEDLPGRGISYVMQGSRVFPSLSVEDNIRLGGCFLAREARWERLETALDLFPELRPLLTRPAGSLSGGEQQMCALARALMTEPKLLLLDEPTVGLAPRLVEQTFQRILEIRERLGAAVVIVEHNLKTLLSIADRGLILTDGNILFEGSGDELRANRIVEQTFFGVGIK
ncbi:ABC transporter ATP-binding protein [Candidatus Uhrbacteria bacterium]|nr:ABC transporter ATP-binding protein [Candidatus Uhrbacteria bacterium]